MLLPERILIACLGSAHGRARGHLAVAGGSGRAARGGRAGPLAADESGGLGAGRRRLAVTAHDLAVRVMRDDVRFTVDDPRFSTAQVVGRSMLSLDGDQHRIHRTAFAAPYRPRRIEQRFGAEVQARTSALLERVRTRGRADLRSELAAPLSVAVVTSALGLQDVDPATVLGWYQDIVAAVTALSRGDPAEPAARAAMGELDAQVRAGLRTAKSSVLRNAVGVLDESEVVANAAVMMFGGIETTEAMITNVLLHLLLHPEALHAVRSDASLVAAAVEESLRLEPAAAVVDRYATADVGLGESDIARGDLVRVSIGAANRDPAVFPAPDEFDLTRPNLRSQLAFAQGPHVCIAMDLARLEARAAVTTVLASLPGLRLAAPAQPTGLVFRKPQSLQVTWDVR
jgi:cytochrome P450